MARYSNASGTPTLAAQNAVFGPVRARRDRRTGGVTLQTGPANAVGAVVKLQGGSSQSGNFYDIDMINPDDAGGAVIEDLTGSDKVGVVPLNASAFEFFRVARTDNTGGTCLVFLTID